MVMVRKFSERNVVLGFWRNHGDRCVCVCVCVNMVVCIFNCPSPAHAFTHF